MPAPWPRDSAYLLARSSDRDQPLGTPELIAIRARVDGASSSRTRDVPGPRISPSHGISRLTSAIEAAMVRAHADLTEDVAYTPPVPRSRGCSGPVPRSVALDRDGPARVDVPRTRCCGYAHGEPARARADAPWIKLHAMIGMLPRARADAPKRLRCGSAFVKSTPRSRRMLRRSTGTARSTSTLRLRRAHADAAWPGVRPLVGVILVPRTRGCSTPRGQPPHRRNGQLPHDADAPFSTSFSPAVARTDVHTRGLPRRATSCRTPV